MRGALQWRAFEDEWVVRAEPSGSLFQLDPLSAAVLGLLESGPMDRTALLASLAAAIDERDDLAPGLAEAAVPSDADQPPTPLAGASAAPALQQALDDTLARLVADDLIAPPARP